MRTIALLFALCALAVAPSAAHAQASAGITQAFVAYGTGVTACEITLKKRTGQDLTTLDINTEFLGTTDCTSPVDQTGHATVGALDGGVCSGVRTLCSSGRTVDDSWNTDPIVYRVSLRAPAGQGWLGAPTFCTGVGTDNLRCEFTANDTPLPVAVVDPRPGLFPPD